MTINLAKAAAVKRLNLHQQRRNKGIPTLSTLVGTATLSLATWRSWSQSCQYAPVIYSPSTPQSLLNICVYHWLKQMQFSEIVLQYLSTLSNESPEQLKMRLSQASDYHLKIFWQSLALSDHAVLTPLIQWVLEKIIQGQKVTFQNSTELADWLTTKQQNITDVLLALNVLIPEKILPGLLIIVDENKAALPDSLSLLTDIAKKLPTLPIAIIVNPPVFNAYFKPLFESHVKAMLREGLIELPVLAKNDREDCPNLIETLAKYSASSMFIDLKNTLIEDKKRTKSLDTDLLFRSEAEKFLFQLLDSIPEMQGIFRPNITLNIIFGDRPLEVDLLGESVKIAIELDGYYHFQNLENYRRDRRKDLLLQQHGYFVLRFLAQDVVERLEMILKTIDQTLQHQYTHLKIK